MSSRFEAACRPALATRDQFGGWVVGPTDASGPRVRPSWLRLRRIRRPARLSRRRRRRPPAEPTRARSRRHGGAAALPAAPIGRVLDAGADAVIVAMVESAEQAAEAVAATRYAPAGVRSFGPLRASLGTTSPRWNAGQRLRDGRDGRGLSAVDEICAVPGLSGIYVGPADLAISIGIRPSDAWTHPDVLDAMAQIVSAATAAGLVDGHARRRRRDRKYSCTNGISDDHAGVGVAGAAARGSRHLAAAKAQNGWTSSPPKPGDTTERHKSDRVALVTGAARGQGAAIVERLLADGFRVAACDVLIDELIATTTAFVTSA